MKRFLLILSLLSVALIASLTIFIFTSSRRAFVPAQSPPGTSGLPAVQKAKIIKFTSEADFKDYLAQASTVTDSFSRSTGISKMELSAPMAAFGTGIAGGGIPERVSTTNVQVIGIDEPDIVKTDGQQIYYSPETRLYRGIVNPVLDERIMPPYPTSPSSTLIISAFPPEKLSQLSNINSSGNLLLSGKTLVIFTGNQIVGYDISKPATPTKSWTYDLESNYQLVTSRLFQNQIYLVTSTYANRSRPCPLTPLKSTLGNVVIPCTDIYHPDTPADINSTFTVSVLNPDSGKISKSLSFVGSSGSSVAYMSPESLYVTYPYSGDYVNIYINFFLDKASDLLPPEILAKLQNLASYDISSAAKMTELQTILERYQNSLDSGDQIKIESEIQNRLTDYTKVHLREIERTGIVKINLDKLNLSATGSIPGHLLNQYSLDEYQNHLRAAVTISGNLLGNSESISDVYILDKNLELTSAVTDLGKTEQIYSVRFVGSRGFVVTFRQTDPFYVLDLSRPSSPILAGELKIPGYSSYLHPLETNLILGIGKEGQKVKLSLFDVSDPQNPAESAKYILDEYWSEALNNHHAFLADPKFRIFFLPAGKGGYIFKYSASSLSLTKAVADTNMKRSLFIDNYLYLVSDSRITVLSQPSYSEVSRLSL